MNVGNRLTAFNLIGCLDWLALSSAALAIGPPGATANPSPWPRSEEFDRASGEPAVEVDETLSDQTYARWERRPQQFIEEVPASPQIGPKPADFADTVPPPPRSCLSRCLPEGLIPAWGLATPDSRKDRGIGEPLQQGGWRAQPFSISGFAGATNGGPLVRNHVLERPSFYGGLNFGWDYDHYWGIEKRLGFGALNLTNAQHQPLQTGLSVTGEYRLMYYPLGDARWRPFITAGIGWSDFYFQDDFSRHHLDTLFLFPFGGGLKYLCSDRWAVRIDLIDELTLGSRATSTFHYVALTAGLEFRYGKRLLHMPWHKKGGS